MSTLAFHLLRLPYLALKGVFCHTGTYEIFTLSTCSRRAYRAIKSIKRSSQEWRIEFNRIFNTIEIELVKEYNSDETRFHFGIVHISKVPIEEPTLEVINFGGFKVAMGALQYNCILDTYWEDEVTGMKVMAIHVSEIFHSPIYELTIGENIDFKESSKWIVDWFNTDQKSVQVLDYSTQNETDAEDASYVFSNLKVDKVLQVSLPFPDERMHPEIKIRPMSLEQVEIFKATWMTLEHILAFDAEVARFTSLNLTSNDFNSLLKHWMSGGFARLELACVTTNNEIDYETVLEGVEFEEIPKNVNRRFLAINLSVRQVSGGFDLTRKSDGSMMTLVDNGPRSRAFELVHSSRIWK